MKPQTKSEAIESVKNGNITDYTKIYLFSVGWVKNQFKLFSSDDLKKAYYESGGIAPERLNVYGAVFSNLAKNKLIFHKGFTTSSNPVAHGRDLKTWISKEYKMKQAENASNKSNLKLEL
jgi:hypothetical protein